MLSNKPNIENPVDHFILLDNGILVFMAKCCMLILSTANFQNYDECMGCRREESSICVGFHLKQIDKNFLVLCSFVLNQVCFNRWEIFGSLDDNSIEFFKYRPIWHQHRFFQQILHYLLKRQRHLSYF